MKALKKLIKGTLIFFLVIMVIGILADPDAAETTKIAEATAPEAEATTPPANRNQRPAKKAAPAKKPDLELLDHKTERGDFGMTHITGRVKNNRSRRYSYVQAQLAIYNEAGEQIETTMANAAGLDAGGVWRFKAHVMAPEWSRYKITDLTGW